MALIELDQIEKTYRMGDVDVRALRSVSLQVERGEFAAIMGASGSGKSTMMNIIGCLDRPTAGSYRLDGHDVSKRSRAELAHTRNQLLGFVFQSFNLLARTSALENVELPLLYSGIKTAERKHRATESLTRVGLGDRLDTTPHNSRVASSNGSQWLAHSSTGPRCCSLTNPRARSIRRPVSS